MEQDSAEEREITNLVVNVSALQSVLIDLAGVIRDVAPESFAELLRRRRLLVQSAQAGRVELGDVLALRAHERARDILELVVERAHEAPAA